MNAGFRWRKMAVLAAAVVCWASVESAAVTIYVDGDAVGSGDGSSWADAYNYLQDAIAAAASAGEGCDVLVAEGVYRPDRSSANPSGSGNRSAYFQLRSDVALRGGYAGVGAADPDARDIAAYETVLSGDLAGNDAVIDDPRDLWDHASRSENCYHVLVGGETNSTAVLEGFVVRGGNANGPATAAANLGGGMLTLAGSPTISHCTFIENSAGNGTSGGSGGAMDNESYSAPAMSNCTFTRNYAVSTGGAVSNYKSAPVAIACTFTDNHAAAAGAFENYSATGLSPTELKYCTFRRNTASVYAGALLNRSSGPTISNCLFEGNAALDADIGQGGAIVNWSSLSTLINCTIVGNRAAKNGSAFLNIQSAPWLHNCIIWDNPDGFAGQAVEGLNIFIDYSCIEYGWTGNGNVEEDPLFARPGWWDENGTPADASDDIWVTGDYHIKSEAGRWDPDDPAWVVDEISSPCIDNGYYEDEIGEELLPNGWIVNMGVYGGTSQASMSRCPSGHPADCYTDGIVNFIDLFLVSQKWLAEGYFMVEDIDRDGIVGFSDLAIMLSRWGEVERRFCRIPVLDDGFEDGQLNDKWTGDAQGHWQISGETVADANFAAQVTGPADEAALTSIQIEFNEGKCAYITFAWRIDETFEDAEYLAFDVSTDMGANWQEELKFDGANTYAGQWRMMTVLLKDIETLQVRFRARINAAGRKAQVDLVSVYSTYH